MHTAHPAAGSNVITSQRLCQELFSTFSKIFCSLARRISKGQPVSWTASTLYRIHRALSSVFSIFSNLFSPAAVRWGSRRSAWLYYQNTRPLSTTFFNFFWFSFRFTSIAQKQYYSPVGGECKKHLCFRSLWDKRAFLAAVCWQKVGITLSWKKLKREGEKPCPTRSEERRVGKECM